MPDKPNFPLTPAWVGKGSAAIFKFSNVPKVADISIQLVITPVGGGDAVVYPGTVADGIGTVYVAGWEFDTVGQSSYEVTLITPALTDGGDPVGYWSGRGLLNILSATATGLTPAARPVIPAESYAYNATTGLYYKITAVVNDDGEITLDVASEGVSYV